MHLLFAILCLSAAAYFLPTIVAAARGHRQTLAIFILNLFLGWSGLGWVVALIWACTNPAHETVIIQR